MKIHDTELVQAIWTLQLKILSSGVLHKYIGGTHGVVHEDWYRNASDIHMCERNRITEKLGKQQVKKRVLRLIEDGYISWGYQNLTFFIDTEQAKAAFYAARNFWLSKGVPTGSVDGRSLSTEVKDIEDLKSDCLELLQNNFRSVDWNQLNKKLALSK